MKVNVAKKGRNGQYEIKMLEDLLQGCKLAGGRDNALSPAKLFAATTATRVIFLRQAGGPVL